MRTAIDRFREAYQKLSNYKRSCTGQPLESPNLAAWPATVTTETEFRRLITALNEVWNERWHSDLEFLRRLPEISLVTRQFHDYLEKFNQLYLGTGSASLPSDFDEFKIPGFIPEPSASVWESRAGRILHLLVLALDNLSQAALEARKSDRLRREWQQVDAPTLPAIMHRVAADLGVAFDQDVFEAKLVLVRDACRDEELVPGADPTAALASLVARHLVAGVERLPCDYMEVLRELDLVGESMAVALLRLAHAIAEVSTRRGERFVELTAKTWTGLLAAEPEV